MPGQASRPEFVTTSGESPSGSCRILYVVGQLHTGGLERQLSYLLQATDRHRYRPAVAVWNYGEHDIHVPPIRALGVPIYSISSPSSRAAKLGAFRRLVKRLKPEVVHSYSFFTNFAAYWGAVGTGAIALGSVRNDFSLEKKESGPLLGPLSARWPVHQISNSFSAAASAPNSRSFFAPTQYQVVSNGLDLARFQPSAIAPDGPARIVGLGYLRPAKRWERLLLAARDLKRRELDYTICIVGDGPLKADLEEQARRLEVTDRVQFIPHTDDVPRLLAASSFLVHPSAGEGCPNAVMEAMACGRAVIATSVGDVPRLIEDGKTGFLVGSGDHAMLVERIAQLITDRTLCRRMGEAGRRKAESDFGLGRLVNETHAAYQRAGWKRRHADELSEAGLSAAISPSPR